MYRECTTHRDSIIIEMEEEKKTETYKFFVTRNCESSVPKATEMM